MLTEEELYELESLVEDEVLCSEKYCPFVKEAMESEAGDSDGECGGQFCEDAYGKYRNKNFGGV